MMLLADFLSNPHSRPAPYVWSCVSPLPRVLWPPDPRLRTPLHGPQPQWWTRCTCDKWGAVGKAETLQSDKWDRMLSFTTCSLCNCSQLISNFLPQYPFVPNGHSETYHTGLLGRWHYLTYVNNNSNNGNGQNVSDTFTCQGWHSSPYTCYLVSSFSLS